jgi:carbamoyl-phosphate synthase large subunit
VFITVTDTDKPAATQLAARFHDLGFEVIATGGTAQSISAMGVPVTRINKLSEGGRNAIDLIRERHCALVINTPTGSGARADGHAIRTAAVRHGIPCVTTMTGATAAARAIAAQVQGESEVVSLQEIHTASDNSAASGSATSSAAARARQNQ